MLWWTLRKLRSSDPVVRRQAVAELAKDSSVAASDALLGGLSDTDSDVLSRAASALADRREPRAIQPLLRFLSIDNPELSRHLDKIDSGWPQLAESRPAIEKLVGWLTTYRDYTKLGPSYINKAQVAVGLVARSRDVSHIPVLMLLLQHNGLKTDARRALSEMDPNWPVNTYARATIQTLQKKLTAPDCDAHVCSGALDVISETGMSYLFSMAPLLLETASSTVVVSLLYRLNSFAKRVGNSDEKKGALQVLAAKIDILESLIKDNKTKEAATYALGCLSTPRAATALCLALKDDSNHFSAVATVALCKSESLNSSCIRPLLERLPKAPHMDQGRLIVGALETILARADTAVETSDLEQLAQLQGPTLDDGAFYQAQDIYEKSEMVYFKKQLDCRRLNQSARRLLGLRG